MSASDELNEDSESKPWMQRYRYHFTDERKMPSSLTELLSIPDLPADLRKAILKAIDELKQTGAVTYPTESRVDYYLHQYQSRRKRGGNNTSK